MPSTPRRDRRHGGDRLDRRHRGHARPGHRRCDPVGVGFGDRVHLHGRSRADRPLALTAYRRGDRHRCEADEQIRAVGPRGASDAGLQDGGVGALRISAVDSVSSVGQAPAISIHNGDGADIDIDPYTEMTQLAMGPSDKPDPRTIKWLDHWREADYQVLRDGDYAVIWFGAIDGWENSPFLFCNTGSKA